MPDKKVPSHTAYALKRESRTVFRWLEIGDARIDAAGQSTQHVNLDRLLVGGFSGHVILLPVGYIPPDPTPQRPEDKAPTHTSYALKRESRTVFRWLEIGNARIDTASQSTQHVNLDRFPVGGFNGHVVLIPIGVTPPDPVPHRPDDFADFAEGDGS